MRLIKVSEIKDRIFLVHYDVVELDETVYKNTYIKTRFIDKDYGEFWNTVKNVLHGQGHPKRAREKLEKTNIERYGVKRPLQNKNVRDKYKETCIEKYGVDNPAKADENKEKMRETNLERYGVEWVGQNEDVKEKIVHSNMERFGVPVSSQAEEVKEKYKQTCLEKYGFGCALQNEDVKNKSRETCLKHFGVDNAMKVPAVIQKRKNTCVERYGVESVMQSEAFKEKSRQTCLKRYGVTHPQKNVDVARRTAKSRTKSVIKNHWKNGKEIVCIASYEVKVIDYFNENKIDFIWQEKSFEMDDGSNRHYIPDCYLPEQDLWIEVKGYFWDDAEEKWNWFHSKYNSELWNMGKLKELKIL